MLCRVVQKTAIQHLRLWCTLHEINVSSTHTHAYHTDSKFIFSCQNKKRTKKIENKNQKTKDNDLNMHPFLRSFNNIDRSGSPIPIEYLPAENTLSSKVRLMILYQNRPTTTIAVGDPLTLRIEAQDGYNQLTDIFATNVMARDPYSGRSIQLIDRYGYFFIFHNCFFF